MCPSEPAWSTRECWESCCRVWAGHSSCPQPAQGPVLLQRLLRQQQLWPGCTYPTLELLSGSWFHLRLHLQTARRLCELGQPVVSHLSITPTRNTGTMETWANKASSPSCPIPAVYKNPTSAWKSGCEQGKAVVHCCLYGSGSQSKSCAQVQQSRLRASQEEPLLSHAGHSPGTSPGTSRGTAQGHLC